MTAPESIERSTQVPRPEYTLGLVDYCIDATFRDLSQRNSQSARRLDENRIWIYERLRTIMPSVAAVYGASNTVSRSVEQASAAVAAMTLTALVTEMAAEASSDELEYQGPLTMRALLEVTERSADVLYRTLGEPVQPALPASAFNEMVARGWRELEAFVGRQRLGSEDGLSAPARDGTHSPRWPAPTAPSAGRDSGVTVRPTSEAVEPLHATTEARTPAGNPDQERAGRWLNAALVLGIVAFVFPGIGILPLAAVAVNVRAWFLAPMAVRGQWRVVLGSLLAVLGLATYLLMYGHI